MSQARSLVRSLALQVPQLRRLVEGRDELLVELHATRVALDAATASLAATEQRAPAFGHAPALETQTRAVREALAALEADTADLRAARAENRLFITEYAYFPAARPLRDSAGGRQIDALFKLARPAIAATLQGIARHIEGLGRIPRLTDGMLRPFWRNDWFPPLDGAALYGLIAQNQPRRYIEVGSGISTRFARQAITDLGLATQIISIDPHPHNALQGLCDETIVSRMEDLPASFWSGLSAGDMLFIDNSHRSFPGSDVTIFFTELLPALPPGVVYGVHDIFLPSDYPESWNERFYSEQYLLMTYLLGGAGTDDILLPLAWISGEADLHGLLSDLWCRADLFAGLSTHGGAFWARRGGAG